jgi:hypothetical protein
LNLADLYFSKQKEKVTLVYDNEPRNKEICKAIGMAIDAGFSVVIFPKSCREKDINEMVLKGDFGKAWSTEIITKLLEQHTYSGLEAKLRFTSWKKC